jgi:ribonuclease P protein component
MATLKTELADSGRTRNANAVDCSVSDTPKGSFPKTAHLLKHPDFQRVYQQGRRHFSRNMTVFYLRTQAEAVSGPNEAGTTGALRTQEDGRVRVGFTVSKALGGSVERNRMRRRTREAVRRHLGTLKGGSGAIDVVINPKTSLLLADFAEISREIERAFRVIRQSCVAPEAKSEKRETRRR